MRTRTLQGKLIHVGGAFLNMRFICLFTFLLWFSGEVASGSLVYLHNFVSSLPAFVNHSRRVVGKLAVR